MIIMNSMTSKNNNKNIQKQCVINQFQIVPKKTAHVLFLLKTVVC